MASFLGCAGGYRQGSLYLIAYNSLLLVAFCLQLGFGIKTLVYQQFVSSTADALWNSASQDTKNNWMNYFECCAFDSNDFVCTGEIVNDCKDSMTSYLQWQTIPIACIFFIFGACTLAGLVSTQLWILTLGKQNKSVKKQVRSKEDFEVMVLGDLRSGVCC